MKKSVKKRKSFKKIKLNKNLTFLIVALIGLIVLLAFASSSTWFKGLFNIGEDKNLGGELYSLGVEVKLEGANLAAPNDTFRLIAFKEGLSVGANYHYFDDVATATKLCELTRDYYLDLNLAHPCPNYERKVSVSFSSPGGDYTHRWDGTSWITASANTPAPIDYYINYMFCSEDPCIPITCPVGNCSSAVDNECGGTIDCSNTCATGESCISGTCTPDCIPQACPVGECGSALDNGCNNGGTINCSTNCATGESCISETCISNCANKECGDDGFGTSCGNCLTGEICTNNLCTSQNKLIAYYPFQGNANDVSGNNKNGNSVGNPTISTYLKLNGNNYINISDTSNQFNLLNNLTISFWFNASELTSGKSFLIYKGKANHHSYSLWLENNKLVFGSGEGYVDSNYNSIELSTPTNSIQPNKWYYCTAVIDRGSKKSKLYLNGGNKIESSLIEETSWDSADTSLYIGTTPESTTNSFNGLIDEVKIWNHVRTDAQIFNEYSFNSSIYNPTACTTDSQCRENPDILCTINTCNLSTNYCNLVLNNTYCDDNVFCNGTETCTASGCQAGSTDFIDDNIDCTKDICNENNDTISNILNHTYCADNFTCTNDICNISRGGCTHLVNNSLCNPPEVCSITSGCFSSSCGSCEACEGTGNTCSYNKCHTQCEISDICYYKGSVSGEDCVKLDDACLLIDSCDDYSVGECLENPCEILSLNCEVKGGTCVAKTTSTTTTTTTTNTTTTTSNESDTKESNIPRFVFWTIIGIIIIAIIIVIIFILLNLNIRRRGRITDTKKNIQIRPSGPRGPPVQIRPSGPFTTRPPTTIR